MEYIDSLETVAPFGGEAVCPDNLHDEDEGVQPERLNAGAVLRKLRKMHVTYLNRIYDRRLLDQWQKIPCGDKDIWKDVSLYDYIGAHLGYRYVIRKVSLTKIGELQIEIENTGFAGIYAETEVWIVAEYGEMQKTWTQEIACDPRTWTSGSRNQLKADIAVPEILENPTPWKLYLEMKRRQDGRRILFANQSDEKGRAFLGEIIC